MKSQKNERLLRLMELKDISQSVLSQITKIPPSTLARIINGKIAHIKMAQKQAIAQALGVSIHAVFEVPVDLPAATPIHAEEAGFVVTKELSPDELIIA